MAAVKKVLSLVRVKLPLDPISKPKDMVTQTVQQVSTIQACAAYPNQPAVQAASVGALADANLLDGTLTKLANHKVVQLTLETLRDQQALTLQLSHGVLWTALNSASKNDKVAAKAWTGAERGVICYLVQQGNEPTNPAAWPAPAISGGSTHHVAGLTIGQHVYFRMAIVRRNGGQGAWSNVLEVTVR